MKGLIVFLVFCLVVFLAQQLQMYLAKGKCTISKWIKGE